MAANWPQRPLAEIAAPTPNSIVGGPFGSNLVSADYVNTGVPVIRGQNLAERWVGGNFVYVTHEKARSLHENLARPGDIVFTQRGTIGQVALIPSGGEPEFLVSQSQMKLTPDPKISDAMFLYYLFKSEGQQEYVRKHAIQTGVPHTNLGILKRTPVTLPPLTEQIAIGMVLGALDDKIELNRRMSETLDAIARALFKSWFVDFDPVHAKAEGRDPSLPKAIADLFPDKLEDSELGEIPTGWRVANFGMLATAARDTITPARFPEESFDHYSIPAFDAGMQPAIQTGAQIKSTKFAVANNAVLLSRLNPTTSRVWVPHAVTQRRPICSTEFAVLTPRPSSTRELVYALCCSEPLQALLQSMATGTSGSHQRVTRDSLMAIKVTAPPAPLAAAYSKIAAPILERTITARAQDRTLCELRDTLLPKLISGEIRVPQAEKFAAAAASGARGAATLGPAPIK